MNSNKSVTNYYYYYYYYGVTLQNLSIDALVKTAARKNRREELRSWAVKIKSNS